MTQGQTVVCIVGVTCPNTWNFPRLGAVFPGNVPRENKSCVNLGGFIIITPILYLIIFLNYLPQRPYLVVQWMRSFSSICRVVTIFFIAFVKTLTLEPCFFNLYFLVSRLNQPTFLFHFILGWFLESTLPWFRSLFLRELSIYQFQFPPYLRPAVSYNHI